MLFTSILATPMPLENLRERDPDTVNNLPDGDKDCNGNTYSSNDIKSTINFSWQAVRDNKEYSMSFFLAGSFSTGIQVKKTSAIAFVG